MGMAIQLAISRFFKVANNSIDVSAPNVPIEQQEEVSQVNQMTQDAWGAESFFNNNHQEVEDQELLTIMKF